jgi:hypothetical protein
MSTSESLTRLKLSPQLEERLNLHWEEVARLREEIGDPQEALFALVRDTFSFESLASAARQCSGHGDDDDLDAWWRLSRED